jgi:hypothetical protein
MACFCFSAVDKPSTNMSNCAVLDETWKYSRKANFWGAKEGHLGSHSLIVVVIAVLDSGIQFFVSKRCNLDWTVPFTDLVTLQTSGILLSYPSPAFLLS